MLSISLRFMKVFLFWIFFILPIFRTTTKLPANTITLTGAQSDNLQENSISTGGDLNGDGSIDLVIGSYTDNKAYVLWGPLTGVSSLDVSTITPSQGFKITGIPGNSVGTGVKTAGDINGDGVDDLVIGDPLSTPLTRSFAGTVYVIYGKKTGISDIDLATLTNNQGFAIYGESNNDMLGYSVSSAGDFNDDGVDDIIIGAQATVADIGHAYIIFGKTTGLSNIDLAALTLDQGIRITGETSGDNLGYSVSNIGDFNGDQVDDVVIGAKAASFSASNAGCAYVIFGKRQGLGNINLAGITSSDGIRINGESASDALGSAVSYSGDVNADTIIDVLIGAPGASKAYVIFGKSTGLSDISLSSLLSTQGFRITGVAGEKFGYAVSHALDMNGDGIDDVVIGAPQASQTSPVALTNSGSVCVVYGKSGITDITSSAVAGDYTLGFVSLGTANNKYYGRSIGYSGSIDGISAQSIAVRTAIGGPISILTGISYYIYWDYTHLATCDPPLQDHTYYGVTFCIHPCSDDPDNPYLYWDGSCQSSCEFPLSSRVYKDRYFCDYPCLNTEYLYPDGTCSSICTLLDQEVIEGPRTLCQIPSTETLPASVIFAKDVSLINKIAQIALSFVSFDSSSMTITSVMLKKLGYVRYLAIRKTQRLSILYNNTDTSPDCLDIAPAVPSSIQDHYNYPPLSFEFSRYDVEASFVVNYWIALISIPILVGICFFLRILDIILKKFTEKRIIQGIVSQLRIILQNFTLQQFYSTFPDITLFALLEFQGQLSGSFSFNFSFLIAIIWSIIGIGLLIIHFILVKRYQKLRTTIINKSENKKALRKFVLNNAGFTILFEDFHDESFLTQSFLLLLIVRVIVFSSIVGLLYEHPFIQVMLFLALGISMLVFLLKNKPHRKSPDLWQDIALEVIVLFVNSCLLILNLQDLASSLYNHVQYDLGEIILYCNIIGRFVPLVCIIIRIMLVIHNRKKTGKEWSIKALINELLDVFLPNPQEEDEKDFEIEPEQKPLQVKIIPENINTSRVKFSKVTPVSDEENSNTARPKSLINEKENRQAPKPKPSKIIPIIEDIPEQKPTSSQLNISKTQDLESSITGNTPTSLSVSQQVHHERKKLLKSRIATHFSPKGSGL